VATGTSTLFSLFWPFPADEAKALNMSHLADGHLGALFVWVYVLLWYAPHGTGHVPVTLTSRPILFCAPPAYPTRVNPGSLSRTLPRW
jgi:hypothetical protein